MTIEHRLEIYKLALAYMEVRLDEGYYVGSASYPGFCFSIYEVIADTDPSPYLKLEQYVELYNHKPEHVFQGSIYGSSFWYPTTEEGLETRINVLKEVIRETEEAIARENKRNWLYGWGVYLKNIPRIFIKHEDA